jgi:uncharacterized protein YeaO (DUF488 family)
MLQRKGKQLTVTLVYAARDEVHNGALALKRFLEGRTYTEATPVFPVRSS